MIPIHFFFRYKNPLFFSIEKVFEGIADQVAIEYTAAFRVKKLYMPVKNGVANIGAHLRFIKNNQAAVNHITGDIHYTILACKKDCVNILTIHDCVLLKGVSRLHPKFWIFKWFWYDLPVRKADVVTVISANTKKEVVQFTGCDPSKIIVIPNFIGDLFSYHSSTFNASLPRILFIGTTPNKNLFRLASSLRAIPCILDIIGKINEDQVKALEENNITYEISSQLSEQELVQKYIECDLVAFPTTYEGFGLPIIEAQAVGRPILTSSLSPMKEVAGNGAAFCDPYSDYSIKEGLMKIINNPEYRKTLITSGLENVKRYRLKEVTRQYTDLYTRIYTKKHNQEIHDNSRR